MQVLACHDQKTALSYIFSNNNFSKIVKSKISSFIMTSGSLLYFLNLTLKVDTSQIFNSISGTSVGQSYLFEEILSVDYNCFVDVLSCKLALTSCKCGLLVTSILASILLQPVSPTISFNILVTFLGSKYLADMTFLLLCDMTGGSLRGFQMDWALT